MKIVFTLIALVMAWWWGSELPDMIKYRYSYTDHRIVISGEKPTDMRISAKVTVFYQDKACYSTNIEGGRNQPRGVDRIDSTESEGGSRYEIHIPVDIDSGNCEPYFSSVSIYGQNKIYDMNLLAFGKSSEAEKNIIFLKTDDHLVATCGRHLFIDRQYITSSYCSLDLNSEEIVTKYGDNEANYIPIPQENLDTTTRLTLDVKKDQYYQSERDKPPKVPDGVRYSNYYKSERRL